MQILGRSHADDCLIVKMPERMYDALASVRQAISPGTIDPYDDDTWGLAWGAVQLFLMELGGMLRLSNSAVASWQGKPVIRAIKEIRFEFPYDEGGDDGSIPTTNGD